MRTVQRVVGLNEYLKKREVAISEAIPLPLSFTRIATSSPLLSVVSRIFPPWGVYLAALFSTLADYLGQSSRVTVDIHWLPLPAST